MALLALKELKDTFLTLDAPDASLYPLNHVFEPEYHQDKYVRVCEYTAALPGAFQIGSAGVLVKPAYRGCQPSYADDENDATSLDYEGMLTTDGRSLDSNNGTRNVCALKSNCVRFGFIDFGLARSVSREFYEARKERASVLPNDVLINSTGDGTIGRVAVYSATFPAIVDGHITVLRFAEPDTAWYAASYLLSEDGQLQMYRYINGSSGQVEIYPQDISRIWIKPAGSKIQKEIRNKFAAACHKHEQFVKDLQAALFMVGTA
jgi:hypothetical protein